MRDYRFTRRAIGLVPQELNFDPFFTVEETLRIQAGYFDVRLSEARLVELLEALDLASKRRANSRALSGGMKRRLLIGKALVHEPRVLFLDEPTAGVDVELRRALWRYVRSLRERGTTVVLTTHYLDEAEELADRVGVIDRGRLVDGRGQGRSSPATARGRCGSSSRRRVAAVPPALAALGAPPARGGARVSRSRCRPARPPPRCSRAVAAAGLAVADVETRRTTLEDVFVRLVAAGARGGGR